ncbi:MAG: hypothetical protein KGJ60_09530 [Verrucomicrobiota bacterium]|nr:hypothetical protein [Verrucomicrobiota bacterium]
MSDEKFNELLDGPLSHPLPIFRLMRLSMTLKIVVDAGGLAAEKALLKHCADLDKSDWGLDEN